MSDTKHTPGPWGVGNGGSVVTQTPDAQVDMSACSSPALTHYDVQDTIEFYGGHVICETVTKANAVLIAAAPDLFEACIAIRAACKADGFVKIQGDLIGSIIFGEAAAQVDAAIEKARGDLPQSEPLEKGVTKR